MIPLLANYPMQFRLFSRKKTGSILLGSSCQSEMFIAILLSIICIAVAAAKGTMTPSPANCMTQAYTGSNCAVLCDGEDACQNVTIKVQSTSVKNLIIRCTSKEKDKISCKGNIHFIEKLCP